MMHRLLRAWDEPPPRLAWAHALVPLDACTHARRSRACEGRPCEGSCHSKQLGTARWRVCGGEGEVPILRGRGDGDGERWPHCRCCPSACCHPRRAHWSPWAHRRMHRLGARLPRLAGETGEARRAGWASKRLRCISRAHGRACFGSRGLDARMDVGGRLKFRAHVLAAPGWRILGLRSRSSSVHDATAGRCWGGREGSCGSRGVARRVRFRCQELRHCALARGWCELTKPHLPSDPAAGRSRQPHTTCAWRLWRRLVLLLRACAWCAGRRGETCACVRGAVELGAWLCLCARAMPSVARALVSMMSLSRGGALGFGVDRICAERGGCGQSRCMRASPTARLRGAPARTFFDEHLLLTTLENTHAPSCVFSVAGQAHSGTRAASSVFSLDGRNCMWAESRAQQHRTAKLGRQEHSTAHFSPRGGSGLDPL